MNTFHKIVLKSLKYVLHTHPTKLSFILIHKQSNMCVEWWNHWLTLCVTRQWWHCPSKAKMRTRALNVCVCESNKWSLRGLIGQLTVPFISLIIPDPFAPDLSQHISHAVLCQWAKCCVRISHHQCLSPCKEFKWKQ